MAEESINNHETRKYAVVTGGNKGIGYEICRQLMKKGVMVVLTARDEKRGKEAVEKLMREGSLDQNLVVFHQVDVVDPASVSSLVDFIKSKYGKLDILVNNAGINGLMIEGDVTILPELIERDAARALSITTEEGEAPIKSNGKLIETFEWAEECVTTNYYGAKRMIEAFIPLLLLSPLPRIVNISSLLGKIKLVSNEWAIKALSDGEGLTTEKVDEVLNKFLVDFKEGLLEEKGWPTDMAAYKLSKAALNAYTRIVAQKYSSICVNCICPGYTKTDITCNTGPLTPEEATESPVILALLPEGGPSGQFFFRKNVLATF
ncbi:PREDICTED: (+)-neomenthol dehydrogenase-like isoform X1 [Nicotiana attenuata]|uniref:(+)-neomenthol dehydrogenase n=1 Tax=Nicotiana attenuata TaxID=49451 RepID=A0A1J6I4P0_NICAT|nr:PREDICTED: (+)-neomenthol dehydrogenase-like isoform X1 [Nicotiana attenuata]OIS99473.1 (+)-neomenthol dehydrogenase [Nicotiana attenuata]